MSNPIGAVWRLTPPHGSTQDPALASIWASEGHPLAGFLPCDSPLLPNSEEGAPAPSTDTGLVRVPGLLDSPLFGGLRGQALHLGRVIIDLDGVVVDYAGALAQLGISSNEMKRRPGAYLSLKPLPGAIDAVRRIVSFGYEVHIATKPPTGIPGAYADKAAFVIEHLPELKRRITITHDKGMLGGSLDVLIDDNPHRANCRFFAGRLIHFKEGMRWPQIIEILRARRKLISAMHDHCRDACGAPVDEAQG